MEMEENGFDLDVKPCECVMCCSEGHCGCVACDEPCDCPEGV